MFHSQPFRFKHLIRHRSLRCVAMATVFDFQLVHHDGCRFGRVMRSYDYKNNSYHGLKATIKLRSDGKVKFSGFHHKPTHWHGSWQWDSDEHEMQITFNYKGNEAKMKTATVHQTETLTHSFQEVWEGRDDDHRVIEMKVLDQMQFCEFHKCWHQCTPVRALGLDHVLPWVL